jgi:hypothetical protein
MIAPQHNQLMSTRIKLNGRGITDAGHQALAKRPKESPHAGQCLSFGPLLGPLTRPP